MYMNWLLSTLTCLQSSEWRLSLTIRWTVALGWAFQDDCHHVPNSVSTGCPNSCLVVASQRQVPSPVFGSGVSADNIKSRGQKTSWGPLGSCLHARVDGHTLHRTPTFMPMLTTLAMSCHEGRGHFKWLQSMSLWATIPCLDLQKLIQPKSHNRVESTGSHLLWGRICATCEPWSEQRSDISHG